MQTIDIFEFARRRSELEGSFKPSEMPNLSAFLANEEGEIRWAAAGVGERRGRPAVRLVIEGEVTVPCTLCNGPVTVEIDSEAVFLFVKSEAEADAMPVEEDAEDEEVTVGSNRFSILDWVEKEAILTLPAAVSHETECEGARQFEAEKKAAADEETRAEKPNPFAALASLKR